MKPALLAIAVTLAGTAAQASSSDAWARFDRDVAQRCAAAARLDGARVSEIVGFDDTLGKVAALVTGRAPQRALRGASVSKLCIYDKRTHRTWVYETRGWIAPAPR